MLSLLDQIFKPKAMRDAEAQARTEIARSREANISQREWETTKAEIKGLKARQHALNDLSIDAENRFAKLAAQHAQQTQNFAEAIDALDNRTQSLLQAGTQLQARVEDLSALCRRNDKNLDALQNALTNDLEQLNQKLVQLLEAGPSNTSDASDELEERVNAMGERLVGAINARMTASAENAAHIEELRQAMAQLRIDVGDIPMIAHEIATEVGAIRIELAAARSNSGADTDSQVDQAQIVQVGGTPATAEPVVQDPQE